jgi:GNAT superfamily N-acetyltransferase
VRFVVEPSPAGGFQIRMQGSPAPLSRHDTEEEAEARRAAYERGADRAPGEFVDLPDGSEVLLRSTADAIAAYDPRGATELGTAWFVPDPRRPGAAAAAVVVAGEWRGRGLGGVLLRRLSARAGRAGIRTFTASLRTEDASILGLLERLGRVEARGDSLEIEVPVEEASTLLRAAATGHVQTKAAPGR